MKTPFTRSKNNFRFGLSVTCGLWVDPQIFKRREVKFFRTCFAIRYAFRDITYHLSRGKTLPLMTEGGQHILGIRSN